MERGVSDGGRSRKLYFVFPLEIFSPKINKKRRYSSTMALTPQDYCAAEKNSMYFCGGIECCMSQTADTSVGSVGAGRSYLHTWHKGLVGTSLYSILCLLCGNYPHTNTIQAENGYHFYIESTLDLHFYYNNHMKPVMPHDLFAEANHSACLLNMVKNV